MQYTNRRVPLNVANLVTDEDVLAMLGEFVDGECSDVSAFIGHSSMGPWLEGDIDFYHDGRFRTLSYDFVELDDNTARIFRFVNHDNEEG